LVLGPAADGLEENDNRLEPSLRFNTVFIRDSNPFFFPAGSGPDCAGVDMLIKLVVENYRSIKVESRDRCFTPNCNVPLVMCDISF
jgi:hypothetical protein